MPSQPKNIPPVKALTLWGSLLILLVWITLLPFTLIFRKKWKYPLRNFEENPRYMKGLDLAYFGYKYYVKAIEHADEGSGLEAHFVRQNFNIAPKDFVSRVTISLGGDLMPYEFINREATKNLWDYTGEFFFGSDIVFANLETPIMTGRKPSLVPEVMLYDMHFNGSEEMFSIFSGNGKFKGYDVLSLANNHMLDQGYEGLEATSSYLDSLGIKHCGSSRSQQDVDRICIVEKNGIKVAFLAYTFSMNKFEPEPGKEHLTNFIRLNLENPDIGLIRRQALKAREAGADFIIASMHCGNAYQVYPAENTVKLYHRIFDEAKVDVIAGGHPHNAQPGEIYEFEGHDGKRKKGFAIYSLGDFVAYDVFHWCHLPLMVKLEVGKNEDGSTELSKIDILPVYKYGYRRRGQFHMQFIPLKDVNYLLRIDSTFRKHFKKYDELAEINRFYGIALERQLTSPPAPSPRERGV